VFSELTDLLPEAHFIQILRDPRAILSSMVQVKKRAIAKGLKPPSFTENARTSIAYIKRCINAGEMACRKTEGKILTIYYEHLLENPESETKKICSHLGIEWDPNMLRPGEKEHLGVHAITTKSNELWYDSKSYNRNVEKKESDKWRRELPLVHQLMATMAFSEYRHLSSAGYDFSIYNLARGKSLFVKTFIYFFAALSSTISIVRAAVWKIPGYSTIKKRMQSMVRVFGIKS
jgi:hypothetical protein